MATLVRISKHEIHIPIQKTDPALHVHPPLPHEHACTLTVTQPLVRLTSFVACFTITHVTADDIHTIVMTELLAAAALVNI